ncbi:hypothetical protein SODALDRAFT_361713 [Sodiomyces alkalinus F11]|uniref:Uncharacterized protein n=1 Tax=Sodiomyces alkalinus (strain CBS 110278 / VKM F-3762 / F11) TaxID=1314773 RepID=A0A3N2PQX7_SODAK|nr:hypothetical protein SODALDRAFT_361713 [Sodiomyces alkalinus F11]ROT36885.1 hypothetical protein SODALDRAFT_361713 [Sodiomyces alkalinus F11]
MGHHHHSLQEMMELTVPPRQVLPPQAPSDGYENRPLPAVPLRKKMNFKSMNEPFCITAQEEYSTASSPPSQPQTPRKMVQLGSSTPLLSSAFMGSPSPGNNFNDPSSGRVDKMTSHDPPIREGLQIRTKDLDLGFHSPTFLDDTSSSTYSFQDDDCTNPSVVGVPVPAPVSEPSRTLSLLDTLDAAKQGQDTLTRPCYYSPAEDYPTWVPASPVPPHTGAFPLDRTRARRCRYSDHPAVTRTSLSSPLSPVSIAESLHHFETIPARRDNYNDYSAVGARDLYHATATQIASSTQSSTPLGSRPSSLQKDVDFTVAPHIASWLEATGSGHHHKQEGSGNGNGNDNGAGQLPLHLRKRNPGFATRVLQTARKSPPSSVTTQGLGPSSFAFGKDGVLTPPHTALSLPPRLLGSPGTRSQFEEDEGKGRMGRYSEAFSRVFRRSGSGSRGGEQQQQQQQQSPMWRRSSDCSAAAADADFRAGSSDGRGVGGLDTPSSFGPGHGVLLQKTQEQWQGLVAQARKTAGAMVMPRDEKKREALRGRIRVMHEAGGDI